MLMTHHDDKIVKVMRQNKWTLCYLTVVCTAILIINIYYSVKGQQS